MDTTWQAKKSLDNLKIADSMPATEAVQMPIQQFLRMEINMSPVQRPTKFPKHLKKLHPTHATFHLGKLGPKLYHLDGHQRIIGWVSGLALAPAAVNIITIHCSTLQEVVDYYYHFDSKAAHETETDRYYGVLRETGSLGVFKSPYFSKPPIYAIKEASGLKNIVAATKACQAALLHLDSLDLKPKQLPSGIVAGLLIIIKNENWQEAYPFARVIAQGFSPEGRPLTITGSSSVSRLLQELVHMKKENMWTGGTPAKMMKELVLGAWLAKKEPRVMSIIRTTGADYLASKLV